MVRTDLTGIKTIIWDLDGTLLDSFGLYIDILREVLPRHDKAVPVEEVLQKNYHGSLDDAISAALGGLDEAELRPIVIDFLEEQDSHYEIIEGHLFKDAEDLANRAHTAGIRQILVTNRNHAGHFRASPRNIVANSELKNYIDLIICGDDSEHRKPKPEVLGDFKDIYVPEETLVIGDQHVDAEFAYNLGTSAVLVNRNGDNPPHLDKLNHDWQSHVALVKSLDDVRL
ncbi:MAG: phosphoglycolate phosphatase [Candidatus Saccharibacteria bacterium]|nr:phosphoglycolate phosphatase [Candidatus Saccharibacteria bacterium]